MSPASAGDPDPWSDRFSPARSLYLSGDLAGAEAVCDDILRRNPRYFPALHLAGVIALTSGRTEHGLALLEMAVDGDPGDADAQRDFGAALFDRQRWDEALVRFDRAIQLKPDHAEALYNRALTLSHMGRYQQATAAYDAIVERWPNLAIAHNARASALGCLGRYQEALAGYEKAARIQPDFAEAHANRALTLSQLKRHDEAIASFDKAIALRSGHAEWHFGRASALFQLECFAAAAAGFAKAAELDPGNADAHHGRGAALARIGHFQDALACYDQAIASRPDLAEAHFDRGLALAHSERYAEALASYERAIALAPDHAGARFYHGTCLLTVGDFDRGWRHYEWRWRLDQRVANPAVPGTEWTGDAPLAGKTLFLRWEQGFGDTIQFIRYARLAKARGARVVVSVQDPLRRLMRTLDPDIEILGGREVPAKFDYFRSLMSLPLAFGTTVTTIPGEAPYLAADPAEVERWRDRLASLSGLRVGLCWAGDPRPHQPGAHATDRRRSIALASYAALAGVNGVHFVSLQKGEAAAQAATPPASLTLIDWTSELTDFADTAALIQALDLVVTVDTAVAHLAGALGKPVWILSRFAGCWRWLTDREDSPWYPGARLFRQRAANDWDPVVADVASALRDFVR